MRFCKPRSSAPLRCFSAACGISWGVGARPLPRKHAARAFWFFLQKQKERKIVSLAGSFEVLQTSNQLTAKTVSRRPLRGICRGVEAPPPTCTHKACMPLALQAFSGDKATFWAFPSGNFSPAFEKAGQKGRRDVVPVAFMGENRITAVFSPNSMIASAIILHCKRQNRRLPE